MRYTDFEKIISPERMKRYRISCDKNTRMAMTLYRLNLKLSQELFTIISCFEVALRNSIDHQYRNHFGNNWLKEAALRNGMFNNKKCRKSAKLITRSYQKLGEEYSHSKLIAEMDFGFWRYLFSQPQFYAGGQILLKIFPAKPKSTGSMSFSVGANKINGFDYLY